MTRSREEVPTPAHDRGGVWRWLRSRWRAATRRLGWRLVIFLGGGLLVLLAASGWLALRLHRQHLFAVLEDRAVGMSETVLSAAYSAMLENDQRHLRDLLENISRRDAVLSLRLLDSHGEIRYSSRTEEIGSTLPTDQEACRGCHVGSVVRTPKSLRDGLRTYPTSSGRLALGLAAPVLNAPECWEASCHVHPATRSVLGILELELATESMVAVLAEERRQIVTLAGITILILCVVIGIVAWRVIQRPFEELLEGTRQLGGGDLSYRISGNYVGELGELAQAFNNMAGELGRAQAELEEWSRVLEMRVNEKTAELERTRDQMVFAEKMVSLGKLAAIVAHEINNPLAGILVSAKLVRRRVAKLIASDPKDKAALQELDKNLEMIERETARSGDIVRNLLQFARRHEVSMSSEDVHVIIERCLKLVRHQADLQEIEVHGEFAPTLPKLVCDANQIEQALLAAIMNAIEAMPDGGTLTVRTRLMDAQNRIQIEIEDTGVGIPEEVRMKIFEPFFSTKTSVHGTGLGLSVLYGIVEQHRGTVGFDSVVGGGTTFRIRLPLHPEDLTDGSPTTAPTEGSRGEIARK